MKLTPKVERFCREMVKPKATQYKAYKAAFNATRMKRATIDNEAYKLMKNPEIAARIAELSQPAIQKVQMTKEEWLRGLERLIKGVLNADTRKMYDTFGNPVEIRELGDDEEKLVEGYEFEEQYTKVKKDNGETEAVPTGYTKKVKLASRIGTGIKAAIEFGKVMGWYTEKKELGLDETLEKIVMASLEK